MRNYYEVDYTDCDGYVRTMTVETREEAIEEAKKAYKAWGRPDEKVAVRHIEEVDWK